MIYSRKNSRYLWFKFEHNGKVINRSTRTANERVAIQIESSWRTKLARAGAGLERDPLKTITLKDFQRHFNDQIAADCSDHPQTVDYYARRYVELLAYPQFDGCPLTEINEDKIDGFTRWKLKRKSKHKRPYSIATVNHCLRTLKRTLYLAERWGYISRVPQISVLPNENTREAIMPREREREWLDTIPEPLYTYSIVCTDLGLRYSEFECLPTTRCNFKPDTRHPLGYVQIRRGENPLKSHWSHRDIPLTRRTRAILEKACRDSRDGMVFHVSKSTLEHQLRRFRKQLKLPQDFVLHSFRHTFGTRLGEDSATAPQIRQLMGHQSMATSQKYVHQLNEGIAELVQRMDARNQAALKKTMFKVVGL